MINKPIFCPGDDTDCPYYHKGFCLMMDQENKDPYYECDVFYEYYEEDEMEDDI